MRLTAGALLMYAYMYVMAASHRMPLVQSWTADTTLDGRDGLRFHVSTELRGRECVFTVSVGGRPWLVSAANNSLFVGHSEHRLEFSSHRTDTGVDVLGSWAADLFTGTAGDTRVSAAVRHYAGFATFDVTLPDGANGTRRSGFNVSVRDFGGAVAPVIDFPSFDYAANASALSSLGALTIQGDQIGMTPWTWGSEGQHPGNGGRGGGPFVLFEDPRNAAVAICPLTHFHTAISHHDGAVWSWGPSGELTSLPAGFTHRTLLVLGPEGVTDAFERMGKALQALHPGATAARRDSQAKDLNLNVLSYYTDAGDEYLNGAPAAQLAEVIHDAHAPFGLVQLDDWFHATNTSHPDNCGCLENWTGNPRWFEQASGGIRGFADAVGLPLALYLPAAGLCPGAGEAHFNISTLRGGDGGGSSDTVFFVPTPADSPKFFTELMAQGLSEGMGHTFEIDFLWFQFLQTPEWRGTLEQFPAYFQALGNAASEAATAIQL
eukprot:COSAG02_NODE_3110_length_7343_cov_14.255936_3_plen_491_part_00